MIIIGTTRRSRSPGGTGSPFAHDEGMHSYEITRKEESDGKSTHISEEAIVLQPSQELHESGSFDGAQFNRMTSTKSSNTKQVTNMWN